MEGRRAVVEPEPRIREKRRKAFERTPQPREARLLCRPPLERLAQWSADVANGVRRRRLVQLRFGRPSRRREQHANQRDADVDE